MHFKWLSLQQNYNRLVKSSSRLYSNSIDQALKWPSHHIRQQYLDYFCVQNNHKFLPSSSVLPKKGSGTYFTNSGMNQFKAIILGEVRAPEIVDFSRYVIRQLA
jgi:alanyl-tRNA synthetase